MKIRTIITQDAEVDDQNSLRHFLFYANEVDLLGIVQTSSKFHWKGVPETKAKRIDNANEMEYPIETDDYTKPFRWTGTEWMQRVVDDYAKDYPNLCKHAEGYPTPEEVRSLIKIGNIGYKGEIEGPSEGSELIRNAILAEDERPLYLQVWGGCNTITRALMDIEEEYIDSPDWEKMHEEISKKIIMTACGEQDETYRTYIAEKWPKIQFVKTLQMGSYAYAWFGMPEGESKETLRADFMKKEILDKGSALTKGYRTWLDGVYYPGEEQVSQFGANPNIREEWFGAQFGFSNAEPYDFLSEGDSPTFFALLDFGFRNMEDFSYGGIAGRYSQLKEETNSKGEPLNYWDVTKDTYIDVNGEAHETEPMWNYVADIQRDFASRVDWAVQDSYEKGEHAPSLTLEEGTDLTAAKGETLTLHATSASPDDDEVEISYRIYQEISAPWADNVRIQAEGNEASLTIPMEAAEGDKLHIIVKAQAQGHYRLVHYQQVIIRIR